MSHHQLRYILPSQPPSNILTFIILLFLPICICNGFSLQVSVATNKPPSLSLYTGGGGGPPPHPPPPINSQRIVKQTQSLSQLTTCSYTILQSKGVGCCGGITATSTTLLSSKSSSSSGSSEDDEHNLDGEERKEGGVINETSVVTTATVNGGSNHYNDNDDKKEQTIDDESIPYESSSSQPNDSSLDPMMIDEVSSTTSLTETASQIISKDKRVLVTIRYSQIPGLRPYYLTIAKKIKSSNPDVIVEKDMIPVVDEHNMNIEDAIFEVVVDHRVIIGKSNSKWCRVRRSPGKDEITANKVYGMSVYVSLEDIDVAIGKARRKRRPGTNIYSSSALDDDSVMKQIGLNMLKGDDDV